MRQKIVTTFSIRLLAAVLCAMATAVHADEGIFWEASAPHKPILLLMPVMHALPEPATDVNNVLVMALARVKSVVVESPLQSKTKEDAIAIQQRETYTLPDNLEKDLGPTHTDALHICAEKSHVRYETFIRYRPWPISLVVMSRVKTPPAYDGIDERLSRGALATHRNFATLLTLVQTLDYQQSMPKRLQVTTLLESCKKLDRPMDNALLRTLLNDWRRGDAEAMALDVEKPSQPGDAPELTEASDFLYTQGSDLFFSSLTSDRIQSMNGPILVAVGAAHLVGRASILPRLQKSGYTVQRVNVTQFPVIPFATSVAATGARN